MDGPDSRQADAARAARAAGVPGARPPGGGGALRFPVLLLSLCALILLAFWVRRLVRPALGERARPPVDDSPRTVPGWTGSRAMPGGGRLEIQLCPMHAEPERERFEALVLERRLGLAPGEPWRLNLSWRVAADTEGEREDAAPLDLAALAVHDEAGRALSPISSANQTANTILDPVAVLFAPPRDHLLPGQGVSLILWGRTPSDLPRLVDPSSGESGTALAETGLATAALTRSLVVVARSPAGEAVPQDQR